MKKILFILLFIPVIIRAQDTVTITGNGNSFTFAYPNFTQTYALGYASLVQYPDTTFLQFNNPNNAFMHTGQKYNRYKNGNTGLPFTSAAAVVSFFNASMSPLPAGTGTVTSITAGRGTTGGTITTTGTVGLDTSGSYTWTSPQIISNSGLGATVVPGFTLQNPTAAISGSKEQDPPSFQMIGHYWNVGVNDTAGFVFKQTKASGSNNGYPIFHLPYSVDNFRTLTDVLTVTTSSSGVTSSSSVFGGTVIANVMQSTANINAGTYISASGLVQVISPQTTTYTTLNTDYTILVDATGGNFTVTLSNAITGQIYNIKKTTAANTVTITPSSGTIDGASSTTLTTQYTNIQVQFDGSNWWLL